MISSITGEKMPRDGEIFGTLPFMSTRVLQLWIMDANPIIHTPGDDLESFVWVGIINALRHITSPSREERAMLNNLLDPGVRSFAPSKRTFEEDYEEGRATQAAEHPHFGLFLKWLHAITRHCKRTNQASP
ncbi:hypothetical protein FRB94_008848 [Tulasnella sp. JGI-2019a]|nr:hypothetical protein FRB93_010326 [Tulasnella sp. JGI-2019a]KAG8995720.1 hypothetical protein FRB94_008848 [Tulasnella sp. JGI-2019a]KAG9026760.1 hypothetical protein FRB95_008509 [Tulasnella sp. JGI-2019a]